MGAVTAVQQNRRPLTWHSKKYLHLEMFYTDAKLSSREVWGFFVRSLSSRGFSSPGPVVLLAREESAKDRSRLEGSQRAVTLFPILHLPITPSAFFFWHTRLSPCLDGACLQFSHFATNGWFSGGWPGELEKPRPTVSRDPCASAARKI